MSPASSDFSAPVQGLVNPSCDQSIISLSRARKQLGKRRRIAALARLVLAVAEGRRLADAELRDLMAVQPDDTARSALVNELATVGAVEWPEAWMALGRLRGGATGMDGRQLDLPLAADRDGRDAP